MEAIFLVCGAGGPQLKRNPLGSRALNTYRPQPQDLMALPRAKTRAKRSAQRVNRIDRWLLKAGLKNPDTRAQVAIDISDSLDAAEWIRYHLSALLRTDPTTRTGADRALEHAAGLGVWAFGELRYHVLRLRQKWETEVETAIERAPRKRRSARRPAA